MQSDTLQIETLQMNSSILIDARTGPAVLPATTKAPVYAQAPDRPPLTLREYASCLQGFVAGLCLEAVLALCLYVVYHLGRLIH
jgi:tetrahydromethanopterin S-methyltransferase subunit B